MGAADTLGVLVGMRIPMGSVVGLVGRLAGAAGTRLEVGEGLLAVGIGEGLWVVLVPIRGWCLGSLAGARIFARGLGSGLVVGLGLGTGLCVSELYPGGRGSRSRGDPFLHSGSTSWFPGGGQPSPGVWWWVLGRGWLVGLGVGALAFALGVLAGLGQLGWGPGARSG